MEIYIHSDITIKLCQRSEVNIMQCYYQFIFVNNNKLIKPKRCTSDFITKTLDTFKNKKFFADFYKHQFDFENSNHLIHLPKICNAANC